MLVQQLHEVSYYLVLPALIGGVIKRDRDRVTSGEPVQMLTQGWRMGDVSLK
jgi:hypothetical protein